MNKQWWLIAVTAAAVVMISSVLLLMEPLKEYRGRTPNDVVVEPVQPTIPPVAPAEVLVRVQAPQANETIANPLQIRGEARGTYFFEASFPIVLKDANGVEIATAIAEAQGDWMTQDFVPFTATLTFIRPASETGTLVFKRDNPSGLPEHDASFSVPVRFGEALVVPRESTSSTVSGGCMIGGCSGEICADEEMMSNCMYRPEFSCYRGASCARNKAGQCAWVETKELTKCIADAKANTTVEAGAMVY